MATQDEVRERLDRLEEKLDKLAASLPTAYVSVNEYDRRLTAVETRVTIIEAEMKRNRDEGMKVYAEFIRQYGKDNQELRTMINDAKTAIGEAKFNVVRYALAIAIQAVIAAGAVLIAHYLPVGR